MPLPPQPDPLRTRLSLLGRIRDNPSDQKAWQEFVSLYGPLIFQWCRDRGLSEADAHDVVQNVLLKLSKHLKDFRYDPARRFRGWLHSVTTSALNDFFRAICRREDVAEGGSVIIERLDNVASREHLRHRLDELFDFELVQRAMSRVKNRVQPDRWRAFELTAVQGLGGKEAATKLGLSVGTVYTSKSQILKMVRAEAGYLEQASKEES